VFKGTAELARLMQYLFKKFEHQFRDTRAIGFDEAPHPSPAGALEQAPECVPSPD
jgi:hypothetical protein